MMVAEDTSETSVNFYQTTWHNNPEDNHLLPFKLFIATAMTTFDAAVTIVATGTLYQYHTDI
jgi:hypothetical protein